MADNDTQTTTGQSQQGAGSPTSGTGQTPGQSFQAKGNDVVETPIKAGSGMQPTGK